MGGKLTATSDAASDPESARLDELVRRLVRGEASEAERAEIELYAERDPGVVQRIERARKIEQLGGAWLARVEANAEIERAERSTWTRTERGVGVGLLLAGWGATFAGAAIVGGGLLAAGAATLLFSFVRGAIHAARKDPYRDVRR